MGGWGSGNGRALGLLLLDHLDRLLLELLLDGLHVAWSSPTVHIVHHLLSRVGEENHVLGDICR